MRFYFYIAFFKGGNIGGHNCTKFEIKDGFLILEGFDVINFERNYWRFKYDLREIKEFQVRKMEESEEQYL